MKARSSDAVAEIDADADVALAGRKYVELQSPTPLVAEDEPTTNAARLVPFLELFSYADRVDRLLMAVGAAGALIAGISQPIQIVLIGDIMNAFNPRDLPDAAQLRDNVNKVALNFVLVSIGVFVFCFLQVACWSLTASRQAKRIRSAYVASILKKDIGWFDVNEPLELSTRVADSTVTIQEGIGRKVGDGLHFFSMAVSGITIGLIKGWELTLVLLAFTPLLAFSAFASMRQLAVATQTGIESYGKAGAVAQESLSNIRTVHMFNAVEVFARKYEAALAFSTHAGIRKGFAVGSGIGVMFFVLYCTYSAGLYFGSVQIANDQLGLVKCVGSGCYDGGKLMTVFFAVIMGAMALGQAGPSIQAVFAARTAAFDVFAVIRLPSKIDPTAEDGRMLSSVAGRISLDRVTFSYPSRPEVDVCRNYTLDIEAGETVALVGPSGSGKSTIVSLLERFYDPQAGVVKLDGVDIRDLNVRWLREQIGLVGQEPALFATSILENIRHGRPSATDEDVFAAARMANAYDFIKAFPRGFNTEVGERDMFMVMIVLVLSMFPIGMAAQNATDSTKAKKAASSVFQVIDRVPQIDPTSTCGDMLTHVDGHIHFKGVAFAYPSRPDAQIYKNYSLSIAAGQTVALVGASGSGKSTAISLLERFYDPASGVVTLDGTDLRKLSLPWLRQRISLVSQEPVLFAGTIAENIAMGKPGATREEVMEAAKKANAFDFISNFPNGFDTDVGDRGAQVSGGQKQRIAIARAILRDPEVLLLDEATSALDNESERVVQESLDRLLALKKRTTIIVAHRLSTIRNADLIAVTKDGAIVEQGTHDQLMALPNGVYKALVARQMGG
ncbi:hypothetical protein P43SY_000315 [Pythium insidiosum]|uniref:Multidrug resistance protein ABC superfamily n=1 Tax=Pythium insidiosum TaxID=114742 RepID=A0AAD5LTS1_PYTIN|nr:hypothetical protein P43SY_000315 [Pythium insidiosum]